MRRKLKSKDNKIGFNFVGVSLNNVVVREATPIDEFYTQVTVASDTGKKVVAVTDPIRMLFNQQRLARIGSTAVEAWLDSLVSHKKDPLAELRAQCSDKDLKALIKSRHIQQPCEIVAWAQQMTENMEYFKSEVARIMAEDAADNALKAKKGKEVETEKTE